MLVTDALKTIGEGLLKEREKQNDLLRELNTKGMFGVRF